MSFASRSRSPRLVDMPAGTVAARMPQVSSIYQPRLVGVNGRYLKLFLAEYHFRVDKLSHYYY